MSDWRIDLLPAGSLRIRQGTLAPPDALPDIEVASNVLLLRGTQTLLVDTAAGALDGQWEAGARSDLAQALAARGRSLDEIDAVVLTHLDFDHCGGAADIPAARVYLLESAAAWARSWPPSGDGVAGVMGRLAGRLAEVADGAEVVPGVRLVEAPGHRSGHACVEIDGRDGRHVFLADVIHHPAHVEHPEWDRAFDTDPEVALATRRRWLSRLAGSGIRCAASHIDGWGTVEHDGDGLRWRPV